MLSAWSNAMAQNRASQLLYELVWVDRHGSETPVDPSFHFRLTEYGANAGWALSPDATKLAIGVHTGSGDAILVKNLRRPGEPPIRVIAFDSAPEFRPRWSSDGDSIRFIRAVNAHSVADQHTMLVSEAVSAHDRESVLLQLDSGNVFEALPTPVAGTMLLRAGGVAGFAGARQVMSAQRASATGHWAMKSAFAGAAIALSPDGRWLAYESPMNGRPEIVVRSYPDLMSREWRLSAAGGAEPIWSRDGRELFFVNGSHEVMQVPLTRDAAHPFGSPSVLFALPLDVYFVEDENYTPFDVAPDGRFIMARLVGRDSGSAPAVPNRPASGRASRELSFRFDSEKGGIREVNGVGTGFTTRLPGSGAGLSGNDSNLVIDRPSGELRMTTTRSWFGADARVSALDAPGVDLRALGFTGSEDFSVTATFTGIEDDRVWDFPDQVGIFVGAATTQAVRAGFWNVDTYAAPGVTRSNRPFAVRTNGAKDELARLGAYDLGDTMTVEISRSAGTWHVRVNGVDRMPNTEQNGSGYPLPPLFLDGQSDLVTGVFAVDGNGKHKTVKVKRFSVRVGPQTH